MSLLQRGHVLCHFIHLKYKNIKNLNYKYVRYPKRQLSWKKCWQGSFIARWSFRRGRRHILQSLVLLRILYFFKYWMKKSSTHDQLRASLTLRTSFCSGFSSSSILLNLFFRFMKFNINSGYFIFI